MLRPLLLILFIALLRLTPFAEDAQMMWRNATNGGVNVLYCYLKVNGIDCGYPDLARENAKAVLSGNYNLLTLSKLAAKNGIPMVPVSLTLDQLNDCPMPLIVHMDGRTPDDGAFLLLMSVTSNKVFFVNGPSATITSLSREAFGRVWSGVALLPAPQHKMNSVAGGLGFLGGMLLVVSIRRYRAAPRKPCVEDVQTASFVCR